ncbi:MAG: DUF2490 domain-containing protein, partial [Gammaproteobacteria bacterium]
WYIYMWNASLDDRNIGFEGDIQHRNWDTGGDLEQLLIRAGVSWAPEGSRNSYTFGLAHITSGEFGPSGEKVREKRIYQQALLPRTLGDKVFLTHRFRFEQRWIDGLDFRTRLRYFFGINYPLNQDTLGQGAIYLSFYNELFVNLERDIGRGLRVDYFDRNRFYLAAGYSVRDNVRLQFGYMHQETNVVDKGQLQFSLITSFQ